MSLMALVRKAIGAKTGASVEASIKDTQTETLRGIRRRLLWLPEITIVVVSKLALLTIARSVSAVIRLINQLTESLT